MKAVDVDELHNDLTRRANSCAVLADEHARYGNVDDARRCDGKAAAYRHAAELVRVYLKVDGVRRAG